MCKFDREENNRIRYYVRMYGHFDDCFVRISKLLPQYTPEQIANHYKKFLDPDTPINERVFETYDRLQEINVNNEQLRKLIFICQELYLSLKQTIKKKIPYF